MCGGTSSIPGWIHGLLPELPAFDLKLGSLNFFLTTNLLTPSKTVIKVDTDTGLMIPGDFYVVGKVNNKTTSS